MKPQFPEMIEIPAGTLQVGFPACPINAGLHWRWHTGRSVKVGPFLLGKFPVTNREYRIYLRTSRVTTPSHINKPGFDADDQPVVGTSWHDAIAYCKWLTEQTGTTYRLPADAEYEYAARGGREEALFACGNQIGPDLACIGGVAAPEPVGSFQPNPFGLYDMVGNVWCWCADRFEDVSETVKAKNNPTNKNTADNRVLRGGSFLTTNLLNLYIAYRHEDPPDLRHECLGFRLASDLPLSIVS